MHCLAVDYGEKRWGLAWVDTELAIPLPLPALTHPRTSVRLKQLEEVVGRYNIELLVLGLPLDKAGGTTFQSERFEGVATKWRARFHLPVHTQNEYGSSKEAGGNCGGNGQKVPLKRLLESRKEGHLDSKAAVFILRDYLEERT